MKVLITGGAGYVGTALVEKLISYNKNVEITIYDNLSKGHHQFFLGDKYEGTVRFIQGDILDSRKLKKSMSGHDCVIHLAAKVTTPFSNTDPHFYEQVNHWGTAEVTYAVEDQKIEKFIYISSASVYGAHSDFVNENTIPKPSTYYGISKLRGEEHVQRLLGHTHAIILRLGNVYGYNKSMRFDAVINKFMFDANFKKRIQIFGDGYQSRAFISIGQAAENIAQVTQLPVPSGIFNVVEHNWSILDIVDGIKTLYPDLEFIFSNQHMSLRELKINTDSALYQHIKKTPSRSLHEELINFKNHFSF